MTIARVDREIQVTSDRHTITSNMQIMQIKKRGTDQGRASVKST